MTDETQRARVEDILGLERRDGFWLTVATITPDAARDLLRFMPSQRPIRANNVKRLVRALRQGEFALTHQGLAFDLNGALIDGQHRLHAIVEAGVTTEMAVALNLPPQRFKVIDRGAGRNPTDDLIVDGITEHPKHGNSIVSAARTILLIEAGLSPVAHRDITNDELMDVIRRYPALVELAREILSIPAMMFPRGPYAGLFTIFATIDAEKARRFREEFYYGEAIERGMPSYELRKQVLAHSSKIKLHREQLMAKCVRAWNAHFENRRLTKLYNLAPTGGRPNEFPRIAGFKGRPS